MINDSSVYDILSRLRIANTGKSSMSMAGGRKSVKKGSSAEFSDFREYMPGDEVRRIDWNAYARLDRLYIKEYMEEREMPVSIFLDTSKSMDYGERNKGELAKNITDALAYISLTNMDRVRVFDLKEIVKPISVSGGKKGFPMLSSRVNALTFDGKIDIYNQVVRANLRNPGITIIVSDFLLEEFFTEEDYLDKLLKYLTYMRQRVILVQVLSEEEMDIKLTGTVNLIDSENEDKKVKVTMDNVAVATYMRELNAFMERLNRTCRKYGAVYAPVNTKDDFYKIIFEDMREIYDI